MERRQDGGRQREPSSSTSHEMAPWNRETGIRPIEAFRRYSQEMDRIFDRMFDRWGLSGLGGMRWPAIEMFERENQLIVRAELPGMKREDVRVRVAGDTLVIEGERRAEGEQSRQGEHRSEWSYGHFQREIMIPSEVDSSKLKARMHNGVLELTMPFKEERRSRDVQIEGDGDSEDITETTTRRERKS